MSIEIYTDGASSRINLHEKEEVPIFKAGWAITWSYKGTRFTKYGFLPPPSSNNIGEMTGVLEALKIASKVEQPFVIYSDSQYYVKTLNEWYAKWKREGRTDYKNKTLVDETVALFESIKHRVKVEWVRGHNGTEGNEIADEFAVYGKTEVLKESNKAHRISYSNGVS